MELKPGSFSRKFPSVRSRACKLAARERRRTEAQLLADLERALTHLGGDRNSTRSRDKLGTLRSAVAELKFRKMLPEPGIPCALSQYHLDENRMFTSTVSISDANTITYIDDRVEQIWGFSPAEMLGQRSFNLIHAGDAHLLLQTIQEMHATGKARTPPLRALVRGGGWTLVIFESWTLTCGNEPSIFIRQYTIGEVRADEVGILAVEQVPNPPTPAVTVKPNAKLALPGINELLGFPSVAVPDSDFWLPDFNDIDLDMFPVDSSKS